MKRFFHDYFIHVVRDRMPHAPIRFTLKARKPVCWLEWLYKNPRATKSDKHKAYHLVTKDKTSTDNIIKELTFRCMYINEYYGGKPDAAHMRWMRGIADKISEKDMLKLSLNEYRWVMRFRSRKEVGCS